MSADYCTQAEWLHPVERLTECAPRVLSMLAYGWKVGSTAAADGSLWVLHGNFAMGHATWILSDNGGELNVEKVNTGQLPVSIPFGITAAGHRYTDATVAARIACVLNGDAIDWSDEWTDDMLTPPPPHESTLPTRTPEEVKP